MKYVNSNILLALALFLALPAYAQKQQESKLQKLQASSKEFIKQNWDQLAAFTLPAFLTYYIVHSRDIVGRAWDASFQKQLNSFEQLNVDTTDLRKFFMYSKKEVPFIEIMWALVVGGLALTALECYKVFSDKQNAEASNNTID